MDNIEKDIAQGYADFADDEGSIEEVETEENIVTENSTSFSFEETTNFSEMSDINRKLRAYFDGKIVRKDLTKSIKEGANVPVYVLEFLLGQYCSSDDPSIIEEGVANVKRILADNYVRPDEAQKILSLLRQRGSHTVIDKITVNLNIKKDTYAEKFNVINTIEKKLPVTPFNDEWEKLKNNKKYTDGTKLEKTLPIMFIILYGVAVVTIIIMKFC